MSGLWAQIIRHQMEILLICKMVCSVLKGNVIMGSDKAN